jgi:nucleotide-binding universal stress UspA family protein
MQNQTVLVLQGPSGSDHDLKNLTDKARTKSTHLSVLHIGPIQPIPVYAYGGMPYGTVEVPHKWFEERAELTKKLAQKCDDTSGFLAQDGVSGDAAFICDFAASLDDVVATRAMFCDIAILQNDLREYEDAFRNILYGILFKSPVGVIINPRHEIDPLTPEHVFVAWNSSLPAAQAVHQALPLLKGAKKVTIATFDAVKKETEDGEEPGADLAKWLSHHGCEVTVKQYDTASTELGQAIQERAVDAGADIVIMGAYGHTRLRQSMFGGTTRTMTEQTGIPVFLAH